MRVSAKVEIPDILASKVAVVVVNVSTCWLEMQKSGSAVWHLPKKALECEQRRFEYIFGPYKKFQMLLLHPTILEAYVFRRKAPNIPLALSKLKIKLGHPQENLRFVEDDG